MTGCAGGRCRRRSPGSGWSPRADRRRISRPTPRPRSRAGPRSRERRIFERVALAPRKWLRVSAGAGPNWERAQLDVHAQKSGGVGAENVAPQRVGNFRRALHEFDRSPFAERVIGAEHDMARLDLVDEPLQHINIKDDTLVVERFQIAAELGLDALGGATPHHPI